MTSIPTIGTFGNFGPQRQDPDAYAKQYASQNGISFDEAKAELKAKYGDPAQSSFGPSIFSNQAPENSYYDLGSMNFSDFDVDANMQIPNENGGIAGLFQKFLDFLKNGNGPKQEGDPESHLNPDKMAEEYAKANNITIDEAKAQLKELYGDPTQK